MIIKKPGKGRVFLCLNLIVLALVTFATVAQHLSLKRFFQILCLQGFTLIMGKAKGDHFFTETGMLTTAWIYNNDFTTGVGVPLDKIG